MQAPAAASMLQPTSVPVASNVPQLTPVLAAASGSQSTAAEGTSTAVALLDWYDMCLPPTSSHGTHAATFSAIGEEVKNRTVLPASLLSLAAALASAKAACEFAT
ncbi:hypothetical protein EYF80_012842 [Liparis tanakae]|uniref:Uncharacterized protein n=1 Tax=Liparis tanakae TaxID=230148 RepID=A0A4Z2IG68_9TELE|nr:hypothetical protein EYF80_012842 [Liparis tanakae]